MRRLPERRNGDLTPLGEIVQPELRRKLSGPSAIQTRYMDAVQAIREEPDAAERAFMARQLILCTLPHSDPGDVPVWKRTSGVVTLSILPGRDRRTGKSIGYPSGSIPRLLFFWMTTEVQYRKNRSDLTDVEKRRLTLGDSLADFMRALRLDPGRGGKRSDAKRLREQMRRLFRCQIGFQNNPEDGEGWDEMQIAPKGELWWHTDPEQKALWQSWIELSEEFFKVISFSPVPLDMRALRALKNSALALDLYAWVCYRAYAIVEKGLQPKDVEPMTWVVLMRQVGAEYSDLKDFKKKAWAALCKIKKLYPGLKLTKVDGGFRIYADRLAVQKRALPGG